jgi:hypothetical protein
MPNQHTSHPMPQRFWEKVDRSGSAESCWPWTSTLGRDGYGQFNVGGHHSSMCKAHRLAWELTRGPIPAGLWVLHDCPGGDNRACCNPAHLFLGTHRDNMRDMAAKGRSAGGERNGTHRHPEAVSRGSQRPGAKLTERAVAEMRACYAAGGASYSQLAKRYGVGLQAVAKIIRRERWAHVP